MPGQRLANYGPQTKSGQLPAFINKVPIMSVDLVHTTANRVWAAAGDGMAYKV